MQKHPNFYRMMLIERWFDIQTRKLKYETNKKNIDSKVVIKTPPFLKTFRQVYKQNMRTFDSYSDCINYCLALMWEGMHRFNVEGTSWKKIATKEDEDTYRQLIAYLQKHILNTAKKECKGYRSTTKTLTNEDGSTRKISIFYKVSATSINQTVDFDGENEVEISDVIENSFWDKNEGYYKNDFSQWCEDNLNKTLTERQRAVVNELLENTNYNKLDDDVYVYFTDKKRSGVWHSIQRIIERVERAYADERLAIGNFITRAIDEELALLTNFMEMVENGASDDELTMAIVNNLDEKCWDKVVYDKLSLEAQKDVIRAYNINVMEEENIKLYVGKEKLSRSTLYEIIGIVDERIQHLNEKFEYELQLLKEKLENEAENKPKKKELEVPENVRSIYVHIDTNGNWQVNDKNF